MLTLWIFADDAFRFLCVLVIRVHIKILKLYTHSTLMSQKLKRNAIKLQYYVTLYDDILSLTTLSFMHTKQNENR